MTDDRWPRWAGIDNRRLRDAENSNEGRWPRWAGWTVAVALFVAIWCLCVWLLLVTTR
jgi:hypothetical protein